MICHLRKAIYSLKQSPRAWFNKFSSIVMATSFQICAVDHSVFIRRRTTSSVVLAVYVDDVLLTISDTARILETKEYLRKHFVIKDMGKPRYLLGIEFTYGKYKMALSQRKYVLDLLQ